MSEVIHIPVPRIGAVLITLSIPAGLLTEQMEIDGSKDVRTWSQSWQSAWISRKQALVDGVAAVSGRKWAMWEHYNPQAVLQMIFQN